MKVLHLISGDLNGGAAKGAYWLHQSLQERGIESRILTNATDPLGDPSVTSINSSSWQRFKNGLIHQIDKSPLEFYPRREKQIFSPSLTGYHFLSHPAYQWADMIHLHWINGGMINVRHLSEIKKPVVWTLRDMWPMTGGCHYSLNCDRYKMTCGKCVQLGSTKEYDLSRINFNRKKKFLPKKCVYVGISPWLAESAKKSSLLKGRDIRMIFNNVSSSDFFPVGKKLARSVLQLDTPKKILLAGAQKITDPYKGFDKFMQAVSRLDPSQYYLAFFGRMDSEAANQCGLEYKNYGFIHDTVTLRLLYSAADVFVAPSLMDAFGKTLVEAMGCGTPVVCFDATGPKDIIDHKINGYKAAPYDPDDLKRGIEWVAHTDQYEQLSKKAREKAVSVFDSKHIAEQYHQLYDQLLNNKE